MGPGSTREARARIARHLLGFSIAYALAHRLGYQFLDPETHFATIWPANGVALAGLLLAPTGSTAVLLAVFTGLAIVSSLVGGHPPFAVAGFGLANLVEISLAFALVNRFARRELDFTRIGDAAALLAAAVVASGVSGLIGAPTAVRLSGASFATCYGHWWVPDMLGLLLVTPLLVSWLRSAPTIRTPDRWRVGEAVAFTAVWTAAAWAAFAPSAPDVLVAQPYVLVALLPWAALRFGPRGVTAAVFGVAAVVLNPTLVPPTHPGMVAIGGASPILGLQAYLTIASTAGLLLASSVRQTQAAEARAREEHERLEFLSNNVPEGTLYQVVREHDGRMRFTYISNAIERLHGIPVEAALGDPALVYGRVRVEDRERIAAAEERSFLTGEPFDEILQVPTPDGDLRWKRITSMPRRLPDGRTAWDGLETDVTEQRRAQDEARRNAEHLELALQSARMGTWEWDSAEQKLILSADARELLGVTPDRPIENIHDFLAITHPDDRGIVQTIVTDTARGERDEWADVQRIQWRDGKTHWLEGRGRLQRGPEGSITGAAGVIADITELKLAEARLARANRALRTLTQCTRSVARACDEQALLDEVCRGIVDVGGYRLAWVGLAEDDDARTVRVAAHAGLGKDFLDTAPLTWREEGLGIGPTGRAIRSGTPAVCREVSCEPELQPWRERALSHGFLSNAAFPLSEGPRSLGSLTIYASDPDAFDDTEVELLAELARDLGHGIEAMRERASRQRAEAALAASEARLRSAMESSPIGMALSDVDGRFEYVNPALCRMLGYSAEGLVGRLVHELIHPDDLAEDLVRVEELLTGKATTYQIEKRYLRADGTTQWTQVRRTLVPRPDGTPPHFLSQVQDITERMQAEQALLKSNARLRLAMDIAKLGYWEYDVESRLFEFDDDFFRIFHTTVEREGGHTMSAEEYARRFLPPDWAPAVDAELEGAVGSADPHYRRCIEHPIRRADGSTGIIEVEIRVVKDATGRTIRTYGANQDITERRVAEQALRESEERLRSAMESSPIGMAIVATDGQLLSVNPALCELLGYTRRELTERTFQVITHPDDLVADVAEVNRLLAGEGDSYQLDKRYIRADGQTIHAQLNVSLVRDAEGIPLHFFSQVQDITERMRAEDEIRDSNAKLHLVMEIAKLGYWDYDVGTGQFTFNDDFYRLFGTSAALEGGYTISAADYARRFLPPGIESTVQAEIEKALATGDPRYRGSIEHEIRRRDGTAGVLQVEARLVTDAAGRAVRIYGANQDITERVRAEEEIRETNRKLRLAVDVASLGYWEYDLTSRRLIVDDGILRILRTSAEREGRRDFSPSEYANRFIPPEHVHVVGDGIQAAVASHDTTFRNFIEHPIVRADGTRGVIQVQVRVEKDGSGRVVRAYGCNQDVTERSEAERALDASEARFRQVVEQIQEVFWMTDAAFTRVLYVSPAYETIWGRTCASAYADPASVVAALHPEDRERTLGAVRAAQLRGSFDEEYRVVRPDGSVRWVHGHAALVRDASGQPLHIVGVAQDITDRRLFEEQFLQAQKLEAIGRLAGGVAHDFNNILAAMMLLAEDVSSDPEATGTVRERMGDMTQALDRAAGLTRQLLAFSRRQVMRPRPIDVNDVVNDLAKMLRRILGEDIRLRLDLKPGGMVVEADTGMIEQVLMNLAVNARDAMPEGGILAVETAREVVDESAALAIPEGVAGDYARIRMTDTGCGIPPENLEHVFEPFFTTKELGKGTGLGLATVFGIVRQHHGLVRVSSVVDRGTIFDVLLPIVATTHASEAPTASVEVNPRGDETILVVEDDAAVRRVTCLALERHGYTVITAESGPAALDQLAAHGAGIDLLLTDVVMPEGMTGIELAAQVSRYAPRVRVILTSGYSADLAERASEHRFLQKPCRPHELLVAVRDVLDGR